MKDEDRRCTCRSRERGEEKRACAPDELAGFGEDLRPVRLDAIVAREGPQSAVELAWLADELLEARPDSLCDDRRNDKGPFTHASPVYGTPSLMRQQPPTQRTLDPRVAPARIVRRHSDVPRAERIRVDRHVREVRL